MNTLLGRLGYLFFGILALLIGVLFLLFAVIPFGILGLLIGIAIVILGLVRRD